MPKHFLAASALAFILVLASGNCHSALASGGVLLPSANNDAQPNLGLVPLVPSTQAQPNNNVAPQPAAAPALPYTPVPQPAASPTANIAPVAPKIVQIPPAVPVIGPDTLFPPGKPVDPKLLEMYNASLASYNQNLPNELMVDVKGTWGANDISAVNRRLGIDSGKVPTMCIMSVGGPVVTSKGAYAIDPGGPTGGMRYDGTITSVSTLSIQALCPQVPVTSGGGFITQVGDKYAVSLALVRCPPPPGSPRRMTILYKGNGTTQCLYN